MKKLAMPFTIGLLLTVCLSAEPAHAQLARTWVASNGDNATTCSRANPCSSLQTAHDKTNAGGEINCVDSGNFASVLITKSITIDCAGALAGDSFSPFMFRINAPGGSVKLRNLSMNGVNGFGATGIDFLNAAILFVENCTIIGFRINSGTGIKFAPPAGVTAKLHVSNSAISDNGLPATGGGIIIAPAGSGSALAVLEHVQLVNNTFGIAADGSGSTGGIAVVVTDSIVQGSSQDGIVATTTAGGAPVGVMVKNTRSVSSNIGIRSTGPGVTVRADGATAMHNGTGLVVNNGASLLTFGNNNVVANGVNGAFSGSVALQ